MDYEISTSDIASMLKWRLVKLACFKLALLALKYQIVIAY